MVKGRLCQTTCVIHAQNSNTFNLKAKGLASYPIPLNKESLDL